MLKSNKQIIYKSYNNLRLWANLISALLSTGDHTEKMNSLKKTINYYRTPPKNNWLKQCPTTIILMTVILFNIIATIFHAIAINLTLVVYVVAVKKVAIILNIFWGFLLFGEGNIRKKILGSLMIIMGVICINLASAV